MTEQDLIGQIVQAHLQIINAAAKGSITDVEAFEKWSHEVAKMHATITLKALLYNEGKLTKGE